jgi:hypothetical protein
MRFQKKRLAIKSLRIVCTTFLFDQRQSSASEYHRSLSFTLFLSRADTALSRVIPRASHTQTLVAFGAVTIRNSSFFGTAITVNHYLVCCKLAIDLT